MSMTDAHPPNPSQSNETTPLSDGKSEHLTVPSWNPSPRLCSEESLLEGGQSGSGSGGRPSGRGMAIGI